MRISITFFAVWASTPMHVVMRIRKQGSMYLLVPIVHDTALHVTLSEHW